MGKKGVELVMLTVSLFAVSIAATFLAYSYSMFLERNKDKKEFDNSAEAILLLVIGSLLLFVGLIPLCFVILKISRYSFYFFIKIRNQMVRNPMGAGIFCGFITMVTIDYFRYLILVSRFFFENYEDSFFFEHHQKRVAAITSFLIGQFLRVLSFCNPTLHMRLAGSYSIIRLFLIFFLFQLFWSYWTIVRNWRFLYPNDKRKRVVRRVILLQLEFMVNFVIQLPPSESQLEKPNSMVCKLVNTYWFKDSRIKVVFICSSFGGWLIGLLVSLIFYKKCFGFIVGWVRLYLKYLKESKGKGKDDQDNNNNPFFKK